VNDLLILAIGVLGGFILSAGMYRMILGEWPWTKR